MAGADGPGADIDRTEPLDEMQRSVAALGAGDFCYLSAGSSSRTRSSGGFLQRRNHLGRIPRQESGEGVEIRILINTLSLHRL